MPRVEYSIELTPGVDGTPLALHFWVPSNRSSIRGLLYYVHGIQSHAGWLFETGAELAHRGVVTCVLDRRGSGRSGGARGDLPAAQVIAEDYVGGLRAARQPFADLPVTVLGQSFGGSIVAALAANGALPEGRLVYCTPALGQQRARGVARLAEWAGSAGLEQVPLALEDEDYTDQPRYLEFMANDPLMLRQITERASATMVELEQSYLGRRAPGQQPVHFVRTDRDPIIELDESERVLRELHGEFLTVSFPTRHHYVEFSSCRRDYWDWLARITVASDSSEWCP